MVTQHHARVLAMIWGVKRGERFKSVVLWCGVVWCGAYPAIKTLALVSFIKSYSYFSSLNDAVLSSVYGILLKNININN
jgi:hypothetical protein